MYDLSDIPFSKMNMLAFSAIKAADPSVTLDSAGWRWNNTSLYSTWGWYDTEIRFSVARDAIHAAGGKFIINIYEGSGDYLGLIEIADSPELLDIFSTDVLNLLTEFDIDGVCLDWENHDAFGERTDAVIKALYNKLHPAGKIVTLTSQSVNMSVPYLSYLDYIMVMAYDFWPPPYMSTYEDTVDAMNNWAATGYPKNRIIMGMSLSGYQASSSVPRISNWWHIVEALNPPPEQNEAYVDTIPNALGETVDVEGGFLWWNGIDLAREKCRFVKNNGFGGVSVFSLSHDILGDPRSMTDIVYNELKPSNFAAGMAFLGVILLVAAGKKRQRV